MKKAIPVTLEHAQLRALGRRLGQMHPSDKQFLWLANALIIIGKGGDANATLCVKGKKGQDDKKAERHMTTQMAIRWIASRLYPLQEEKSPTKAQAIAEAAKAFDLDEENLKRACPTTAELKELVVFSWDSQRPRINKPRD